MKKLLLAAAAVAVLTVGSTALAGSRGTAVAGPTTSVKITSAGFDPATVAIQAGDAVSWTNSDTVRHRVVVTGASCSLTLDPSQTSSCTFAAAGTFSYSDPTASGSGFSGTINVAQSSRSVTLRSSRSLNIFGDAVTLSGTTSGKTAGEHVTVVARPAGLPVTETVVTTTSGGNWSLQVQPRVKTTYQALYENASSSSVTVNIRPRITLQKVGRQQYLVVVLAARSMAGKRVDVTRWIAGRGWVRFRSGTLQSLTRTPTTSVLYFTTSVRLGTKLRIFMSQNQVGPDYLDAHSNFIVN
jgi:plastocyanin